MNNPAIELRHLRHFLALAEELHFGRAAARCNISQPPFSVSIRQLEASLGYDLIERRPNDLRLTKAGKVFYEEASKALAQIGHAMDQAARVNEGLGVKLRIGFFASMLDRGLDRLCKSFQEENPGIVVQLVELSTVEQILALQRRQLHYGFVHTQVLPEGVIWEELLTEPFVLCVPETDTVGSGAVDLLDYKNLSFILFSRSFSPTYYDQVVAICISEGFQPKIEHEARHWLTVISCVARGLGVALVPRSMASGPLRGVRFLPLRRESAIGSTIWGIWNSADSADAALLTFRRAVKAQVSAGA
jgi:DNA-binding transcriptional LysR family regulator